MAIAGIRLVFGLLPFEENYTFADVFGLIFVCVWILIVLSMGIFAFATNSKQITINNDGVLCKSWLHKTFVKWTDIKIGDYLIAVKLDLRVIHIICIFLSMSVQ